MIHISIPLTQTTKTQMWKATNKKILGWQKTEAEKTAIIENNIIQNFKQNVCTLRKQKAVLLKFQ